jgi:hypothetical protein
MKRFTHCTRWLLPLALLLLCICALLVGCHKEPPYTPDAPQGGEPVAKSALVFTLMADGSYAVSAGEGLGTRVSIPATHEGKPVRAVAARGFLECESLCEVILPEGLTVIGERAFAGCTGLSSLTLPRSLDTLEKEALRDCASLCSLTLPEGLTVIGDAALEGCSSLTSLQLPASLSSLGKYALFRCTGLNEISVAPGNAVYTSVSNCVIERATCTLTVGIATSVIPEDGSVTRVGEHAFAGCVGLTTLVIPDAVTHLSDGAFQGCTALAQIVLGKGIRSIGYLTFEDCAAITALYYKGSAGTFALISACPCNEYLLDAPRFYYSDEPRDEHWCFDENGKPAVWS